MEIPNDGAAPGLHGVYPAIVTSLVGPPRQGQVEVRFPSLGRDGDTDIRAWATLCSPYADGEHGLQILPEVGSQVLVAFGSGQVEDPYVIGACWNGKAAPPERATRPNNLRLLKSRAESTLTFDDTAGAPKLSLTMKSGHKVELDDAKHEIVIRHSNGPVITLNQRGEIKLECTTVEVTAVAVNVHAPTTTFDGIVNCKVMNASVSLTSPLYSVGVGNLL